jgi:hypothetical protein
VHGREIVECTRRTDDVHACIICYSGSIYSWAASLASYLGYTALAWRINCWKRWKLWWPFSSRPVATTQCAVIRWPSCCMLITHVQFMHLIEWIFKDFGDLDRDFFFRITQYIRDTHNARTLISMNTRTQTRASSKTVPANPQGWRSHHRRLAVDGNVAFHWKHKRR